MAIVQSLGQMRSTNYPPVGALPIKPLSELARPEAYSRLYRTQPHVRTVVDFIARNIAQLGFHVFKRISDTDRERVVDHELALWIEHPNPATTRYRLIESLLQDLGVYFNAYWLKMRRKGVVELVRLPPQEVTVTGVLLPDAYLWTPSNGGNEVKIPPKDIVAFGGYNPDDPLMGLSPLETLRGLLAEHQAGSTYRERFLANAARLEGVVTRPKDAPRWSTEQKQSWREQWQQRFSGSPGQVAVLEDGMSFIPTSYSARESEFIDSRKLTREEVAAAYHVPLPMVGILEHATFSNIREQHKHLYQDCLGPWCEMIVEEIERQLLIECSDFENVYAEFNIAEKLKGSFEEQAIAMQTMVGRPVMTVNEGRARLNLPKLTDDPTADEVSFPLNMGSASAPTAVETADEEEPAMAARLVDMSMFRAKRIAQSTLDLRPVLRETWRRQASRLMKLDPAHRAKAFDTDRDRWDDELEADLLAVIRLMPEQTAGANVHTSRRLAGQINNETQRLLERGENAFDAVTREASLYAQ